MMGRVGSSGGWLSEKNSKKNFVPNELKSPKNNKNNHPYLGVSWVAQTQIWI